jgi:hypothetical protein
VLRDERVVCEWLMNDDVEHDRRNVAKKRW